MLGTISRAATLALYESDIEKMYSNLSYEPALRSPEDVIDVSNLAHLEHSLTRICERTLRVQLDSLSSNFFDAGADSLRISALGVALAKALKGVWTTHSCPHAKMKDLNIDTRMIYIHPTVDGLPKDILRRYGGALNTTEIAVDESISGNEDYHQPYSIDDIVSSCTAHLSPSLEYKSALSIRAVLLTESTGSLGSYILDHLIKDCGIDRIYCLNRTRDGQARQELMTSAKDLSTSFDIDTKVRFLQADLSQPNLGIMNDLEGRHFQEMQLSVRCIIRESGHPSSLRLVSYGTSVLSVTSFYDSRNANEPFKLF